MYILWTTCLVPPVGILSLCLPVYIPVVLTVSATVYLIWLWYVDTRSHMSTHVHTCFIDTCIQFKLYYILISLYGSVSTSMDIGWTASNGVAVNTGIYFYQWYDSYHSD